MKFPSRLPAPSNLRIPTKAAGPANGPDMTVPLPWMAKLPRNASLEQPLSARTTRALPKVRRPAIESASRVDPVLLSINPPCVRGRDGRPRASFQRSLREALGSDAESGDKMPHQEPPSIGARIGNVGLKRSLARRRRPEIIVRRDRRLLPHHSAKVRRNPLGACRVIGLRCRQPSPPAVRAHGKEGAELRRADQP